MNRRELIQEELRVLVVELEKTFPVSLFVFYLHYSDCITIGTIKVYDGEKNKGFGTQVMTKLCEFSDKHKTYMALTPVPDFGGQVSRLKRFYKRFGFKKKPKDIFTISELYVREHKNIHNG